MRDSPQGTTFTLKDFLIVIAQLVAGVILLLGILALAWAYSPFLIILWLPAGWLFWKWAGNVDKC